MLGIFFTFYYIERLALVLGAWKLLQCVIAFVKFIDRHFKRNKKNLFRRYGGKGTWALVTGGSDGIGAEFCRQLAKDGFNICIVSRTVSKMEAIELEVRKFGVETMSV